MIDLYDHRNRASTSGLRARQLALAAGLDYAERLLVEVDRAPAQREQLAAAAQAGERGGGVEGPVRSELAASASWMTASGEKKPKRPWS